MGGRCFDRDAHATDSKWVVDASIAMLMAATDSKWVVRVKRFKGCEDEGVVPRNLWVSYQSSQSVLLRALKPTFYGGP
jgi:hypothetical protein